MIKNAAFVYLNYVPYYLVTKDTGLDIQTRPKLGLQYLCAVLEKKGIHTEIFDQLVTPFTPTELIESLKRFDMVGFYCSDPQEENVKAYCTMIKAARVPISINVGGPSTANNTSFLEHGCDIVVHGEGEETICEIVEYLNNKRHLQLIDGISYLKDGLVITTPTRKLIEDIDKIPFPDRSKTNINSYYDYFIFGMEKPFIHVMASRGCLHRCHFCVSCKNWQYKYRQRSVDNVLAEIDEAVKLYGVRYVCFQDDIWGARNDWIEEFCNKLLARPYKIRWLVILHPFSIPKDQERILQLMKAAGCDTLSFGLQSAHPDILTGINRDPREPAALKKLLGIANKVGISTAVSYIFGLPGDTPETIQTTIDFSNSSGATLANYFNLVILRNSELEKMYGKTSPCSMPEYQIVRYVGIAYRSFYTRPKNLVRIGYYVMQNPAWVAAMIWKMPSLLAWIGFRKVKA
jgi:anaerobic magnesium-protoporphyrin IX monomethyl ester cyclase